ncbi:MAG: hypothetical protein ACK5LC_18470, partial [Coprobacillaceae bacterium]
MNTAIADHYVYGPNFMVENNAAGIRENQIAQFDFETGHIVKSVRFPFDNTVSGNKITEIEYKTNKNSDWQSFTDISKVGNSSGYSTLHVKHLNLDEDEYLISIKANCGSFKQGFKSSAFDYTFSNVSVAGTLDSSLTSAKVTLSLYDKEDKDNTIVKKEAYVYKATAPAFASDSTATFKTESGSTTSSITAGNTFQVSAKLGADQTMPLSRTSHLVVEPELYLKQPKGMQIVTGSIVITNNDGTNVEYTISDPIQRAG